MHAWLKKCFDDPNVIQINTGFHYDKLAGNGYLVEQGIRYCGPDVTPSISSRNHTSPTFTVGLEEGLARLRMDTGDLVSDLKLAVGKVVLANWINLQCGIGNRWLSEFRHMGSIYNLSKAVSAELKDGNRRRGPWRSLGAPK